MDSNLILDENNDLATSLRKLRQERGGFKASITRKRREIRELMITNADIDEVQCRLDQITETLNELNRIHCQYTNLASHDEGEIQSAELYLKMIIDDCKQTERDVQKWTEVRQNLPPSTVADSINPQDSVSQSGRSKTSSSTSSLKLKTKAHKAALLAKKESLIKTQELRLRKLQIEQETERIMLEGQIKATEAEEEVYNCSKISMLEKVDVKFPQKDSIISTNKNEPIPTHKHLVTSTERDQGNFCDKAEDTDPLNERSAILQSIQQQRQMLSDLKNTMDNLCKHVPAVSDLNPTDINQSFPFQQKTRIGSSTFDGHKTRPLHFEELPHAQSPLNHNSASHTIFPQANQNSFHNKSQLQIDTKFIQLQQTMLDAIHMPRAEIITFDGNPLTYWTFIRSFEGCVDKTDLCYAAKLNRLFQYCKGKARDVIDCCAIMEPENGYVEARRLLLERFGNKYSISKAWISKITEGNVIRSNDGESLRKFADDVKSCILTLSAMGRLTEVDNQIRMVQIVGKLPGFLQGQWRKNAVRCLREQGIYPDIIQLLNFIEIAAQEATDPVFGKLSLNVNTESGFQRNRSTALKPSGNIFNVQVSGESQFLISCHLCSENHPLIKCDNFRKFSTQKKFDLIVEKGLCYNCFSSKHFSKQCTKDSRCNVNGCNKFHSKLIHECLEISPSSNNCTETARSAHIQLHGTTVQANAPSAVNVALPVVPVLVKSADSTLFQTYALLDSGSTNTFCSRDLLQSLGIIGKRTYLSLTTLEKENSSSEVLAASLELTDINGRRTIELPRVFATYNFPSLNDNFATLSDIRQWSHLDDVEFPPHTDSKVTLIIGQDVPEALIPTEVRRGKTGDPYAVKTILGWSLNGPIHSDKPKNTAAYFVQSDDQLNKQVDNLWKLDFCPATDDEEKALSRNDKRVIKLWDSTTKQVNGHYEIKIPFKNVEPCLPNNYTAAEVRLNALSRKLLKDKSKFEKYCLEIEDLITKGYAEIVPEDEINSPDRFGKIWYLPHHGVTNINKPEKLRVVFDCAARYGGVSLNDVVLQGPDLSNKLLGVLLRFREDRVAVMGDVESMFHQVKVNPSDRDVLRFLWWKNCDPNDKVQIYRMTVHLFGGIWSPSCANYALKLAVSDETEHHLCVVKETIHKNFYVDDCLKSVSTTQSAIQLIKDLSDTLNKGGFQLKKWISNDKSVLGSVPLENRANDVKDLDLETCPLPVERALGIQWDTHTDRLGYRIFSKDRPFTRRGLLSIMSSIYDPLGFVSPFVLLAKFIFQAETKRGKSWDSTLEPNNLSSWTNWLRDLQKLQNFWVPRCILPNTFNELRTIQLHHFCDACVDGYGVASYVRFDDGNGKVYCTLVMAKSRLTPIKTVTIPRLELMAAVLASQMDRVLRRELSLVFESSTFWTDSEIVLRYLNSTDKRFQTFVANRVSQILNTTEPTQWKYVESSHNPADDASRGLTADKLLTNTRWIHGPAFLSVAQSQWREQPHLHQLSTIWDMEIKRDVKVCQVSQTQLVDPIKTLLVSFSSWYRLKRAVGWILRLRYYLLNTRKKITTCYPVKLSVLKLQEAEVQIVKLIQEKEFKQELKQLSKIKTSLSANSVLFRNI